MSSSPSSTPPPESLVAGNLTTMACCEKAIIGAAQSISKVIDEVNKDDRSTVSTQIVRAAATLASLELQQALVYIETCIANSNKLISPSQPASVERAESCGTWPTRKRSKSEPPEPSAARSGSGSGSRSRDQSEKRKKEMEKTIKNYTGTEKYCFVCKLVKSPCLEACVYRGTVLNSVTAPRTYLTLCMANKNPNHIEQRRQLEGDMSILAKNQVIEKWIITAGAARMLELSESEASDAGS